MTSASKWLGSLPVIFVSGAAMLAIGAAIRMTANGIGGDLLDFQLNGADAIARLQELRTVANGLEAHQFISGRLDMAYPFAYGLFFASLAMRFSKSHSLLFALPMALAIVFDISENLVQLQGLAGNDEVLHAKTYLTPAKFGCVAAGMLLAIWFCLRALLARRQAWQQASDR